MELICPNCKSVEVMVRPCGRLLPFFVKRVFEMEPPTLSTFLPRRIGAALTRLARGVAILPWLGMPRPLDCEILICSACDFVCPALDLEDHQLLRLYRDYRSDSYNAERTRYEPSYRDVAALIGRSQAEHEARLAHMDRFLSNIPRVGSIRGVLDYAGADGRFIPSRFLNNCECTVYEVSDVQPWRSDIRKVTDMAGLGTFDYIQVCHLLEHVRRPSALLERLIRHLAPDGFIYLEVPKEGSSQLIESLRTGAGSFPIHEHINLYTETSLAGLLKTAGLDPIRMATAELDLGWCEATVLSAAAMARRNG